MAMAGRSNRDHDDYLLALAMQFGEDQPVVMRKDVEQINSDFKYAQIVNDPVDPIAFQVQSDVRCSVIDAQFELADPNPDIWELFREFDSRFFGDVLKRNFVELEWSARMTNCAGLCAWNPANGLCSIKLSKPLLQLRPRSDLVETLIHEMIHALLFVTKQDDNHESHGNLFHAHMFRINKEGKCKISVYHSFHDEVQHYQNHVWRCSGPCKERQPYFGYVRRAMNRAPGSNDIWWKTHQSNCDGQFIKVSEPEKPTAKSKGAKKEDTEHSTDIRDYFTNTKPIDGNKENSKITSTFADVPSTSGSRAPANTNVSVKLPPSSTFVPFTGSGSALGTTLNTLDSLKRPRFGNSASVLHVAGSSGASAHQTGLSLIRRKATDGKKQSTIDIIQID